MKKLSTHNLRALAARVRDVSRYLELARDNWEYGPEDAETMKRVSVGYLIEANRVTKQLSVQINDYLVEIGDDTL